MFLSTWILFWTLQIMSCKIIDIQDKNDFKKMLTSHSNILVSFLENDKVDDNIINLLKDVSVKGNKQAKVVSINCQNNKKLCKHYKADPKPFVIQHFNKGKFNKVYDRKLKVESMLRFLDDPTGDITWEEEDTAKDVIHVRGSQDLQKIVSKFKTVIPPIMLMFYAPWCNYCKLMKPEFAAAATLMKGKSIFIGINGEIPTTDDLKQAFNITGYPSVFLIQDGNKVFKYDNDNSRDAFVKFVSNPTKPAAPKETSWSEETTEIEFLTEASFYDYVNQYESVLIMFYAPWCGHCKSLKPVIIEAAVKIKELKIDARIAAIDSTENKNISEKFKVKGFPTLKFFKHGEYMYDINERTTEGLLKFIQNPVKPVEPEAELPWKNEESSVLHPSSDEFRSTLKKFKHALVMFYAPWCGHCKSTKPLFTAAANRMQSNYKVAFIAIDCTDQLFSTVVCKAEGITGFPTLRYFNYGKNTSYSEYSLEREEDDFVAFMTNPSDPKLDARRHWRNIPGNEAITILESDNFVQNIVSHKSGALVMFYAPWCGHCVAMKPAFVNAAVALKKSLPFAFLGTVDATSEKYLAAQHKVSGFPTLIYFSPNGDWVKYNGGRTEEDLTNFMIKKYNDRNKEEEQQQIKEEKEKKQAEEDKKIMEEKKRQSIEEEKRINEEKKRIEEENRINEEQNRINEEKKNIEEQNRINEEKKRIEEQNRINEEKKKIEEQNRINEEKKRIEEQKRVQEEKENKRLNDENNIKKEKQRIEEENRIKAEKEKKKIEEEKLKQRLEEEKENQRIAERKRIKIEEEKQKIEKEKEMKQDRETKIKEEEAHYETNENIKENKEIQFIKLSNKNSFIEKSKSKKISTFYLHKKNRKSSMKTKFVKLLGNLNREIFHSYEVDCSEAVDLCDHLNVVDDPIVVVYKDNVQIGSLVGSWSEDHFTNIFKHSSRDEL